MEEKHYQLGKLELIYLISEEGRASMLLLPSDCTTPLAKNWELGPGRWDTRSEHIREWRQGNLVQLQLGHHSRSRGNGTTMKFSESTGTLKYAEQWQEESDKELTVVTRLTSEEGYEVLHHLLWKKGVDAVTCKTEFVNGTKKVLSLEMLSSFCLENLSPYQLDSEQTGVLRLHRFYGNWALEGRHVSTPIEDLGLQKAWGAAFTQGERFGSQGSWTTHRFFPTAVLEDREHHIFWGATLECMSSWQMEVTRDGDTISFSGGLGDAETGAWTKNLEPGEHFVTPSVRLSAVQGDLQDVCQQLLQLQDEAAKEYGEQGAPIQFNEYCSSWGNPTQEKELEYARILQGKGIKYFVIDAGWSEGSHEQWGNGEWILDRKRFPDMKEFSRKIREMGMIPGIWFEFEVTTGGSRVFAKEFDHMHLKRNGEVIRFGTDRSFWDFRQKEVQDYLKEKVLDFLKENDLGYMKVDYNGNIGIGCDGAESLGEGLRQQMEGVKAFFVRLKQELPELIIENCASGGHRLEATMMSLTGLSSFSDCHEAEEIPVIAGNVQYLCIPRQNLIWAVLRSEDTLQRIEYSITAGFLGRLCLSGDIERLSKEQWDKITAGIDFYYKAEKVIIDGVSKVYRSREDFDRHHKGIQVVTRKNDRELLVVYHGFEEASDRIVIPLEKSFEKIESYGQIEYSVEGDCLVIQGLGDRTAGALYMSRG